LQAPQQSSAWADTVPQALDKPNKLSSRRKLSCLPARCRRYCHAATGASRSGICRRTVSRKDWKSCPRDRLPFETDLHCLRRPSELSLTFRPCRSPRPKSSRLCTNRGWRGTGASSGNNRRTGRARNRWADPNRSAECRPYLIRSGQPRPIMSDRYCRFSTTSLCPRISWKIFLSYRSKVLLGRCPWPAKGSSAQKQEEIMQCWESI